MASKIYAIKKGFDFSNNEEVFNKKVYSWADCQKYIKGVKGALYKSFSTEQECDEYFNLGKEDVFKDISEKDILKIYVDGSYNSSTDDFAYGYVAVLGDIIINVDNGKQPSDKENNTRQVAGELLATLKGLEFAKNINAKNIQIYHDYIGIRNHATGEWKRDKQSSIDYYNKVQSMKSEGFIIDFVKVDAHTNVLLNELADELCKYVLNIPSDKNVDKYVKDNTLKVSNLLVKAQISKLVSNDSNIIVASKQEEFCLADDNNECDVENQLINIIKKMTLSEKEQLFSYLKK